VNRILTPDLRTLTPHLPMGSAGLSGPRCLLVCGLIVATKELLARAEETLRMEFGEVEERSQTIDFGFTHYYEPEMGPGLLRCWLAFSDPVDAGVLAEAKLKTNELEPRFADEDGNRKVNLDPGLLSAHNLVLATTKDFGHRVYLGRGIFAETTLIYEEGEFRPLDWTYPDYRDPACLDFLARCRDRLLDSGRLGN